MSGDLFPSTQLRDVQVGLVQEYKPAPQWYVAYTAGRHEKSVAKQLGERDVDHFLPLYEAIHRWRNGRHRVQLPLFPGYIFVRISAPDRCRVLQVPGVAYIVGSHGIPTALPQGDIEQIQNAIHRGVVAQPFPYLKAGKRVEIRNGPLKGLTGILKHWRGGLRVVISLDLIMQSIAVEVDAADVGVIHSKPSTLSC